MPEIQFEQAQKDVERLVSKFRQFQEAGQVKRLGEEETKKTFITPLFRALGWDMENDYSLDEVINEEKVSKGRVDYSFRINGIPKFFLEAKALNKGLDEVKDASQAINYAWHKGTSWAVLTDFQTLVIYNAEVKDNNLSNARFKMLTFDQFADHFSELWLLSKTAFQEGLLDKSALSWGKKLRRTKVGDQLLSELMQHRALLSKNIVKNNAGKNLSEEDVDEAVQRIIDRLIFIRTAEDRNIEPPTLLPKVREFEEKKRGKLTSALNEIYLHFDKTYNSKLFTFDLDDLSKRHLCETLEVENEVLGQVITGLYESKDGLTHYDFSAIDADVLGNIYEQYLSHILKKTEKRAKVESREAHRKEQGIYYTPTYIVDYIVRNTLGEVIKNKKPGDVDKLRVLDMACGSGSFLLKAFDVLDDYYKKKDKNYAQNKLDLESEAAQITRKTKILKNNIYGVDLDPKAVEIAQLNLLLKAAETKHRLPDLRDNIKCGNSLIDQSLSDEKRPFDWHKEFHMIIDEEKGFDAIIGNPPYLNVKRGFFKDDQEFLESRYETAKGQYDLYRLFIERGLTLLKEGGFLGFIIPRRSFTNENEIYLREFLLKNCNIRILADAGAAFSDASVEAGIIIIQKGTPSTKNKIVRQSISIGGATITNFEPLSQADISADKNLTFNIQTTLKNEKILKKIEGCESRLGGIVEITRGVEAGKKSELITDKPNDYPLLFGEDVSRYRIKNLDKWIKFSKNDPANFKKESLYSQPKKLLIRRVGSELIAAVDYKQRVTLNTLYVVEIKSEGYTPEYLCALLNSSLIRFWFKNRFVLTEKLFPYLRISQLLQTPIKMKEDEKIQFLVEKIIQLSQKLVKLGDKQTDEKSKIGKEISELDRKIDELVYGLYGLTSEERKIVEEAVK